MTQQTISFKNHAEFLKFIKDEGVQFADMNFTDLRGKWHHITEHTESLDQDKLKNGVFFDGSSIVGWRAIHQSDMILMPDITHVVFDPFAAQKTVKLFCDV